MEDIRIYDKTKKEKEPIYLQLEEEKEDNCISLKQVDKFGNETERPFIIEISKESKTIRIFSNSDLVDGKDFKIKVE